MNLTWTQHEDDPGSEDRMSSCGRFEALLDPVYGHINIHRREDSLTPREEVLLQDSLICQVMSLREALPHIEAHLARFPGSR